MLLRLDQKAGRGLVVSQVDVALVVIRRCTGGVWETLFFNMDYFNLRISDLTNLLIFGKVYIDLAKVADGNVNGAAQVNVHGDFGRYACMIFGHVAMGNYPYMSPASVKTKTSVSYFCLKTICLVTVMYLWLPLTGVTNSVRSWSINWQIYDEFLLNSCTFRIDTSVEWWGTTFLWPRWISFENLSVKVFPYNMGTGSLSSTQNVTPLRELPMQMWRMMVTDRTSFVLEAHRI